MIFGHLGVAFFLKAKFYKRSLIILTIFSFLPDIIFYILFGTQNIMVNYPPISNGLLGWLISVFGSDFALIDFPLPMSHSIVLYVMFISLFLILAFSRNRIGSGLIYSGAILSHFLFDFLMPDANLKPERIIYPFYPFDPDLLHGISRIPLNDSLFWVIDLIVFIAGFFVVLWAFSRNEAKWDYEP
ncbi:MAG: hypothetical protein HWN66_05245 [Candidatus Helarchaeota archaeon]|nr:hypothetical protein [Candidatus Helarchaeota archaeon]